MALDVEGAAVALALGAAFVAWMLVEHWDDARLDDLRMTTVEECGDRTESVAQLADCVEDSIAATGQKP